MLLQAKAGAGQRSARADRAGEAVNPPPRLCPDFGGGRLDMRKPVGGIVELIGPERARRLLGDAARGVDEMIGVRIGRGGDQHQFRPKRAQRRSEEHTSELQSLMRISYAVFCLKKKKTKN